MKKAPGKSHREGISLEKLFQMFPDDATAEKWFVEQRWPDGAHCPHCGSVNVTRAKHRTPCRISAVSGNAASGSASALERLWSVPNSVTRFG